MTKNNEAPLPLNKDAYIKYSVFSCKKRMYSEEMKAASLTSSNYCRACLVMSGSGMCRVFEQEFPCSEGDICIIPSGVIYGFYLSEQSDSLTVKQIEFNAADWFDGGAAIKGAAEYCYGVFDDNCVVAYSVLAPAIREKMRVLYEELEEELSERGYGWETLVRGCLEKLFVTVARCKRMSIKNLTEMSSQEYNLTIAVINIVNDRCGDSEITLKQIADGCFVSQSYLSRIFKKSTGVLFSDYLRGVRIKRACKLLEKNVMTNASIARECGFCDINTFYKAFGAIMGMTPKAYKQSLNLPRLSADEDNRTRERKNEKKVTDILSDISENLQKGKLKFVEKLVQQALDEGAEPQRILKEGLISGMSAVGEKFKNNEVYVPEVLVAARAMNIGAQLLKPYLISEGVKATGRVCIGTVQGDLHDIGKNLVKMMIEGKGLEVFDLGTDVAPETFVQAAIDNNCQVICCSALLTTTMPVMEQVVKAAEAAGIRDKVKIMIGGAPISEEFCKRIGADCYTLDASSAADAAAKFCSQNDI